MAANFCDPSRIQATLRGIDLVFSLSVMGASNGLGDFEQRKLVADSAMRHGVKYIIWSTLPSVEKISQGIFRSVKHCDEKAKVEDYIRWLQIKSSFVVPAFYFQNVTTYMKSVPINGGFGAFNIMKPDTKFPCIDIEGDFGTFVGVILTSPERFAEK